MPLQNIIPSYLYWQYSDDDNLQAFVAAYNELAQEMLDWFNETVLPDYTNENVSGPLLDWVALGLYGMARPALPISRPRSIGPYNTVQFNQLPFNAHKVIEPADFYETTDDIFRRILTWHIFKADGKVFNIRWLKRRIQRFLTGANGLAGEVDETYQISVTFGVGNQVNIGLLSGVRILTGGALYNRMAFNSIPMNKITSTYTPLTPLALGPIFQAAVEAGALELPFQFTYVVTI